MVGRGCLGCGNTKDPKASSLLTVSVDMCGAREPELLILKQTARVLFLWNPTSPNSLLAAGGGADTVPMESHLS